MRRRSGIYCGWYLLAAAVIISVVTTGARSSFAFFALPMSQDLEWSYAAYAGAIAIGQLMNGLTQPVIGYLFDRFNSRKVILICVAAAGLATSGLYWASLYWHLVLLFSFVFSIAMGGASLAVLWPLAARWFRKRLGLVLGLLTAAPSLGRTLVGPTAGLFLSQYGWQIGWLALGAILLFLALPVGLKFLRNWPSDIGLKPDGDPETPPEIRARGNAPALQRGRFEVDRWWRAFRSPAIWALLPALAVGGFTSSVISHSVESFAADLGHYSPTMASAIYLLMVVLGGAGSVAGGWLADRSPRKKVLAAVYLAQGIVFLWLVVDSQTFAGLWVFFVVAGLCWVAWMPVAFALVVDVYGLRSLGAIWGIAFLFQQVGGSAGPILNELVYQLAGFPSAVAACASMQILMSIVLLAINERKYSGRYQAAVGEEAAGN